jgi:hypothetical protein
VVTPYVDRTGSRRELRLGERVRPHLVEALHGLADLAFALAVEDQSAAEAVGSFAALVRIDTPQEALYYRHGGILRYVLPAPARAGEAALESFAASDPPGY